MQITQIFIIQDRRLKLHLFRFQVEIRLKIDININEFLAENVNFSILRRLREFNYFKFLLILALKITLFSTILLNFAKNTLNCITQS